MPLPKLDRLSYTELLDLQTRIEAAIKEKRAEEQEKLREKVAEMAAAAGFQSRRGRFKEGQGSKEGEGFGQIQKS